MSSIFPIVYLAMGKSSPDSGLAFVALTSLVALSRDLNSRQAWKRVLGFVKEKVLLRKSDPHIQKGTGTVQSRLHQGELR